MKVVISPTAQLQLKALAEWWDANRRDARVRVEAALELAIEKMAQRPAAGPYYSGDRRYRTWRLKGTPYLLFYRIDASADAIIIVVAWSAKRGMAPTLP